MSLKSWVVGKVNRVFTRADLVSRHPLAREAASASRGELREPMLRADGASRRHVAPSLSHLGPYAPLIAAIRNELEQFAETHLRLHVAIAERDRYLLTSIVVDCTGHDEPQELLRRFSLEFTPEQIKHYLAKEVIARLPNASMIDLSQFAGLGGDRSLDDAGDDDDYGELMSALRAAEPAPDRRAYRVTLVGRWSEVGKGAPASFHATREAASGATPLAGRQIAVEVEDAGGERRIELTAVVPGRRYVVGKDEGCDIVVDGVFASRRHCELWLEQGRWWIADAGSTNGIRVESNASSAAARRPARGAPGDRTPLELPVGARVVLSESEDAAVGKYPRLSLRALMQDALAAPQSRSHATPITPIASPLRIASGWTLTAKMASGTRTIDVVRDVLPFRIGRSRSQALVIDWTHEGVSGHHVDLVDVDDAGARVAVHGDNGVTVDGTGHPSGAQFLWKAGETMVLGRAVAKEPECTLTLSRRT